MAIYQALRRINERHEQRQQEEKEKQKQEDGKKHADEVHGSEEKVREQQEQVEALQAQLLSERRAFEEHVLSERRAFEEQMRLEQRLRAVQKDEKAALKRQMQLLAYSSQGISKGMAAMLHADLDHQYHIAEIEARRASQVISDWMVDNGLRDDLMPDRLAGLAGDRDWVVQQWVQACLMDAYAAFFEREFLNPKGASFLEPRAERAARFRQYYYAAFGVDGNPSPPLAKCYADWVYSCRMELCNQRSEALSTVLGGMLQREMRVSAWEQEMWKLHLIAHAFPIPPALIRRIPGRPVKNDVLCQETHGHKLRMKAVAGAAQSTRDDDDEVVVLMTMFGLSLNDNHVLPCRVMVQRGIKREI